MKSAIFVFVFLSVIYTVTCDEPTFPLRKVSDSEYIENSDSKFSCENRQLGYYADVEKNCDIFHICDGKVPAKRYTFACINKTKFNQPSTECIFEVETVFCEASPSRYDSSNRVYQKKN
uniref:SLPTX1 n=1 Tax=Scolopendra viridis TaxID=118503 RepID=A0A4D5R924_SCOVI